MKYAKRCLNDLPPMTSLNAPVSVTDCSLELKPECGTQGAALNHRASAATGLDLCLALPGAFKRP